MITDLPEPNDFFTSGWRFLNYGWSQAMDLLIYLQVQRSEYLDYSEGAESPINHREEQEFWELGSPTLITSLALIQQGIELLLKGCIAQVSPYLLISDPRSWPGRCDKSDIPFSQFRTIDAQDLIKVYDTVSGRRISEDFKERINELRKHRNIAFHSVSSTITVEAYQILLVVFEAVDNLNHGRKWLEIHKEFLERDPISSFTPIDREINSRLMREMEIVVNYFPPEVIEKYTGYRVAEKSYICPRCSYVANKMGGKPNFAQVVLEKTETVESIYCFSCCESLETIRTNCQSPECNSNFLSEDGICLLCNFENELGEEDL